MYVFWVLFSKFDSLSTALGIAFIHDLFSHWDLQFSSWSASFLPECMLSFVFYCFNCFAPSFFFIFGECLEFVCHIAESHFRSANLLLFCVCYWFSSSFHLFNLAFCSAPSHLCFINDSECFLTSIPSVMMLEADRRKDSLLLHIKASSEYWGFAAKGLQSKSLFTHVGIYLKVSLCAVTCRPPLSFLGPLPSCIF